MKDEKKTVLVTRDGEGIEAQLRESGFEPIILPLISIAPSRHMSNIEQTLENIDCYQWLFFTSKNAVKYFFFFFKEKLPSSIQIAVVGVKTKQAVETYGYNVSFVASAFDGDTFAKEVACFIQENEKVLFPKGNLARKEITGMLRKLGVDVTDLIIYETTFPVAQQVQLVSLLKEKQFQIIIFASPSAIENFVRLLEGTEWRTWIQSVQVACIGPITNKKAMEVGIESAVMPSVYTFQALVEELRK